MSYTALEGSSLWYATEQSCETNRAVIAFDDEYFFVESHVIVENESSFSMKMYCPLHLQRTNLIFSRSNFKIARFFSSPQLRLLTALLAQNGILIYLPVLTVKWSKPPLLQAI